MKVLLVSELLPPVRGGLERHVEALSAELSSRGHDVRAATLTRNPQPMAGSVHSIHGLAHLLPHDDPERPFHPPVGDPWARTQLQRVVSEFRPDVIHAHNWLAASLPRRTRHHARTPLVITMHDYSLICHLRTMYYKNEAQCTGPGRRKCVDCGRTQLGAARAILLSAATVHGRRVLRPDAVVAVSNAVADAVRPHLDLAIDVVPNFVGDAAAAQPLPAHFPSEGPVVLYAGDPGSHKGVDDLLTAWSTRPVPGATLVMASTKPRQDSTPASVRWMSLTPGQMTTAWQRASLGVVPSRWAEPCPTVILEAKRAAVPVVATSVGGIPDLVTDGVDGLLVPPRDPHALIEAIHRLIADDALRAGIGAAARASVAAFEVGEVATRLIEIYERVARPTDRQVW